MEEFELRGIALLAALAKDASEQRVNGLLEDKYLGGLPVDDRVTLASGTRSRPETCRTIPPGNLNSIPASVGAAGKVSTSASARVMAADNGRSAGDVAAGCFRV